MRRSPKATRPGLCVALKYTEAMLLLTGLYRCPPLSCSVSLYVNSARLAGFKPSYTSTFRQLVYLLGPSSKNGHDDHHAAEHHAADHHDAESKKEHEPVLQTDDEGKQEDVSETVAASVVRAVYFLIRNSDSAYHSRRMHPKPLTPYVCAGDNSEYLLTSIAMQDETLNSASSEPAKVIMTDDEGTEQDVSAEITAAETEDAPKADQSSVRVLVTDLHSP